MKRLISVGTAAAVLAVVSIILVATPSRSCWAGPLLPNVLVNGGPMIDGSAGTLSYSTSTGVFDVSVLDPNALTFVPPGQPPNLVGLDPDMNNVGSLVIDLRVDQNGNFVGNGAGVTLIGGVDIDGDGTDDASGTLLTGTITAFGAQNPAFDGFFTVTGGLLTSPVNLSSGGTLPTQFANGATGEFLLFGEQVTTGQLGVFTASFASSVKSNLGLAAVPEPGNLVLALVGIVTLGGYRLVRQCRTARARRR